MNWQKITEEIPINMERFFFNTEVSYSCYLQEVTKIQLEKHV